MRFATPALLFGSVTSVLLCSAPLQAAKLEEVIVTAQHREQSLQDVPVSVSAMGGEKMMEAGITRMEDLQAYIPNLTVTPSGLSTDIFIRGIGSGMNQGFEQSVGMYVDGVYYGRAQLAQAPFLDLARVEILRGPQNILHGKNSIAGAISIITADPGEESEGWFSTTWEDKYDTRINDLMLSGMITDTIGLRFSARLLESEGYVRNLTLDRWEPQRDEATYRLKIKWDSGDNSQLTVKLEAGSFDRVGAYAEVISDLPSDSTNPLFTGRTEAEILDSTAIVPGSGLVVDVDTHDSVLNNYQDFKRSSNGDYGNNDTRNVTVRYDIAVDEHDYSVTFGYLGYKYNDLCDCDSTAAPLFKLTLGEDYQQYSGELRWLSPVGETFEYIGGLYLQHTDLLFYDKLIQDSEEVVKLLNADDLAQYATTGQGRGDFDPNPLGGSAEEIAGVGDAGNAVANITAPRDFTSVSDIASAFLQATINLSQSLKLTLGGRYTYEKKDTRRRLRLADLDGNDLPIGEVDTVSAIAFAAERHDLSGSRSESQFSPLVNMQWYINEEIMTYATVTRGFKAGGFDARSNQSPSPAPTPANPGALIPNQVSLVGTFEYDEEIATSVELGSKIGLLDGAAELNVAIFYTLYEDLQTSIFDGTLGFNVGNAKEAVTQGIELDGRWQITEYFSLGGALALLDFEFTDFENGDCRQGQQPDAPNGRDCDYTGESNQYVSDWSGTLLAGFAAPLSDTIGMGLQLDVVFTDDYNPSSNIDPRVEQDGFYKVNAQLGIGAIDKHWELSVIGKNLTDETVITYVADTPLAYTIFGAVTHTGFVAPPRTYALQYTYRW